MKNAFIKWKLIICIFLLLEFAILVISADVSNTNQEVNEQEGNKQVENEQEVNKQEGNEQEGNEQEGNDQEGNEPEGNDQEGNEPEGNEHEGTKQEGFPWRPNVGVGRWFKAVVCSSFKSCAECINKPCTWSLPSASCNKCTVKRDKTCHTWSKNTTFITAANKNNIKCPSFKTDDKIIYVPSGVNKSITVKLDLGGSTDFLTLLNYNCSFKMENKNVEVKAKLLSDTLYCDPVMFSYDSSTSTLTVPMKVYAGSDGYFLENPDNISIEIYKCSEMAKSCKSCVSIENKYNCAWCGQENNCDTSANCNGLKITEESYCK